MSSETGETLVASNILDACCDVVTDAVPDQPRRNDNDEKQPRPRPGCRPSKNGLNEETPFHKTAACLKQNCEHSSFNKPSAKTKTARSSRYVPRSHHQPQGQGVSYVTYNISNTRDVQIGNKYTFNITPTETSSKHQTSPMKETKEIQKLLQSSEPVTLEDISIVSMHVGTTWKEMGRLLNYTGGQLDQFDANHGREGLKEVVYQLLLDWKQVNTSKATVGMLCSILKSSHQRDAMNEWAKVRS